MIWFNALHFRFNHASKSAKPEILQFVSLFLCFPCFEVSHFFFKLAYALQHRRALILCRKRGIVGVYQLGLKFEKLPLKRRSIPETYHCLRDILCSSERVHSGGNGGQIGH